MHNKVLLAISNIDFEIKIYNYCMPDVMKVDLLIIYVVYYQPHISYNDEFTPVKQPHFENIL